MQLDQNEEKCLTCLHLLITMKYLMFEEFDDYCEPRKDTTMLAMKYKQLDGQTFYDFVTELRNCSENCEFDTLRDS